jgi:hypothetical protein
MLDGPHKLLTPIFGAGLALTLAPAATAQVPDQAKWVELQAKAKQEGQVVLAGPPRLAHCARQRVQATIWD